MKYIDDADFINHGPLLSPAYTAFITVCDNLIVFFAVSYTTATTHTEKQNGGIL